MIFAALGIFAGLSMNLVLHFAVGAAGIAKAPAKNGAFEFPVPLAQILCLFLSSLVFWFFYYYVFMAVPGDFLDYFLVFPLSCLICYGVETLVWKIAGRANPVRLFPALSAYNGLVLVSFILVSRFAVTFSDGLVLSFFFSLGCLLAAALIAEIRRKASLEWVPSFLRGSPLALISMGLLSMVFAGISGICFRVLGIF